MAKEKRLIDANAIKYREHRGGGGREYPENIVTEDEIAKLPTVDAVEVVRCKDCKHYMTIHCTCDGCCISDEWYCADGERKRHG